MKKRVKLFFKKVGWNGLDLAVGKLMMAGV